MNLTDKHQFWMGEHNNRAALTAPVVSKDWPAWAKTLKRFAKPQDRGIGDVVARKIGEENSDAFKKWYKRIFGKDCGCTGRHAEWNAKYPLPKKNS